MVRMLEQATLKHVARTRPLPARKVHLFQHHQHLLTSSPLLLFLRPTAFTAQEWSGLRSTLQTLNGSDASEESHALKLTVLRPGLLPALLRDSSLSTIDVTHLSTPSHLSGTLAVLTSPSLHPPTLRSLLKLLNTISTTPSSRAAPIDPKLKLPPLERLPLLSSLLEHRSFGVKATADVGELPGLDILRAQVVGLLSAPAGRISSLLGQRAQEVGRTLEGFMEGLKEGEEKVEG
jgi:large subunit ribosomal protein L10